MVFCHEDEQVRRVEARDGLSEEQARARVRAQMSLSEKRDLAGHVIDNTGACVSGGRGARAGAGDALRRPLTPDSPPPSPSARPAGTKEDLETAVAAYLGGLRRRSWLPFELLWSPVGLLGLALGWGDLRKWVPRVWGAVPR